MARMPRGKIAKREGGVSKVAKGPQEYYFTEMKFYFAWLLLIPIFLKRESTKKITIYIYL